MGVRVGVVVGRNKIPGVFVAVGVLVSVGVSVGVLVAGEVHQGAVK